MMKFSFFRHWQPEKKEIFSIGIGDDVISLSSYDDENLKLSSKRGLGAVLKR